MGDAPDVPELEEDQAISFVHRVSNQFPSFNLLQTVNSGAAQSFATGDTLLIVTPALTDVTLADVAVTLQGTR